MNVRGLFVLPIVGLTLLCGCELMSNTRAADGNMSFEISESERETAISLSQDSNDYRALAAEQQIYFIDVEVFRDKDREAEGGRQFLVTHYAAAQDLAILSVVDFESGRLVNVETVPNLPVRLSQEEYEIAKRMALEEPKVQAALRGIEVEIEAQLSRTADEEDPQFGHRVVHFLFKTPTGYLASPNVIVDVTAGEVFVE
jgi:hypothetical protein